MLGDDVLDEHLAAGGGNGGHIGARLDLVGDDGVGAAGEAVHPPDLDDVGTGAHDVGAHGVEEVGQVHDVGLLGGVFNHRHTLGQHGGQHDVHGGPHGYDVQIDVGALHPAFFGPGVDKAAPHVHLGAHGHKALDVLVDGPPAEVAAPRRGHLGGTEPAQQGADEVIGGPDLPGQLLGHPGVSDMGAVHVHRGAVDGAHVGAQLLEDIQNQGHIADLGNIFNAAAAVHQQGGGNDSDSGVLRAADVDFTKQRFSAVNHIFCQSNNPLFLPPEGLCAFRGIQGPAYPRPGKHKNRRHLNTQCAPSRVHYSIDLAKIKENFTLLFPFPFDHSFSVFCLFYT